MVYNRHSINLLATRSLEMRWVTPSTQPKSAAVCLSIWQVPLSGCQINDKEGKRISSLPGKNRDFSYLKVNFFLWMWG